MQCLILAGGPGTRMKPLTERLPKSLIPVNGVPFVHYQLDWLARQGVRKVVFAVGYLGDMIRAFVGDGGRWGLEIAWVNEGKRLRGTAGAIRLAIDEGVMDEKFLVLYGDSYLLIKLPLLWTAAKGQPHPMMTVFRNDGRWDKSNVIFEDGRVTIYEKGRADEAAIGMRHIDYGLSVLSREVIIEQVAPEEWADLADVFHRLSVKGQLLGYEVNDRFHEIGSPEGLKELEEYLGQETTPLEKLTVKLPLPDLNGAMTLEAALAGRRSVRDYADKPLSINQVSQLLWAAQGITHQEERRAAPSAGAIYPLEVHLAAGNVDGIKAGVYRYASKSHALSLSAAGDFGAKIATAALAQEWIAAAPAILIFTGVASRMTPKYGSRSDRYITQESGHAAQNVLLQAVTLDLGATPVGAFRDDELKRILRLSEDEAPLYIVAIGHEKT